MDVGTFFTQEQHPLVGILPVAQLISPGCFIKEPWALSKTRELTNPPCKREVISLHKEAAGWRECKGNCSGWQKTPPAKALQPAPPPSPPPTHLICVKAEELIYQTPSSPSSASPFLFRFIHHALWGLQAGTFQKGSWAFHCQESPG